MKHLLFPAILMIMGISIVQGQFYYKDIVSNKQVLDDIAYYKKQGIHKITIKSFEDDGAPSKGFFCKKSISKDYRKIELGSRSSLSSPSIFTSFFNENGSINRTYDSSDISATSIHYTYDSNNKILSIFSTITSRDDDFITEVKEEHIYSYNKMGLPENMLRIKNLTDTSVISFVIDEKNNISMEKDSHTGSKYYYYYDDKNRITDIVKENEFQGRMIPDYLFEYNEAGSIAKMMSTEEGNTNYYIWSYEYNSNGLRSKEKIYSKEKRLLGTLEYIYQ